MTITTTPPADWVGRKYADGQCWDFVRDAFAEAAGITLPASYYDAVELFGTVHDAKRPAPFTPQPWDVVMIRTHPFLILHCAIALDAERFIHPWGDHGLVISSFADEPWSRRIAGFLRLK